MGSVVEVLGLRLLRPFPLSFVRAAIEAVRVATMDWRAAISVAALVDGAATALAAYLLTTVVGPPTVWSFESVRPGQGIQRLVWLHI